jgi:uncharacterized protein YxjI
MAWYEDDMKRENQRNLENRDHRGSKERGVIAIACGKIWQRSATITGLRMPWEAASSMSMGKPSVYGSTWVLRICRAKNWPRSGEKVMRIKDTYSIYRKGNVLATVKKALITPRHQRFDVHVAGGENMEVQGNIAEHEYAFYEGRNKRAEVSKKWFRVADTYGVDIVPGADDSLILAITVVIDMMVDEGW